MMNHALSTTHCRRYRCGCALLNLQQQRGILDFDQCVHVLQPCLHEGDFGFDRVISEGNGLADYLLAARHEIGREQLYELVLNVLNKIEFGCTIAAHNEDCEETMRLLDARVDHFYKNVGIIIKFDHQFLSLLHCTETVLIN